MSSELENDLYAELCESLEMAEDGEVRLAASGAEVGVIPPTLIALFKRVILAQIARVTCENKEVVIAAAQRCIADKFSNPKVAEILTDILTATLDGFCK